MRVALIGPVPPRLGGATPGGVATHQVQLAAGLAGSAVGVEAALLATNTRVAAADWKDSHEGEPGLPLYRMATSNMMTREYLSSVGYARAISYAIRLGLARQRGSRREILANVLWYRRFLAHVRPDVIHVQHPLERCQYARIVRRLERWRTPLVVTAHSLFGEHPDEAIHRFMAPNLCAADRVIAVSEHIADQAIELGVSLSKVSVIRSGVDTERFAPRDRRAARRRLGLADSSRAVLFVGNLEPRKQVDVLLRAFSRARERVPNAVLLIIGTGESAGKDDQTRSLVRLASELRLGQAARFIGRVDDQRLLDYYAAADAFALSSTSEAQGIVALEAMASGLPVIATAVGGLLGTIDDGVTGFLVPVGDVNMLAQRLVEVLTDEARRLVIGAAARQAVEGSFTWARAVEATVKVYREVLACPQPT